MRIQLVELGDGDHRMHGGCALAAAIGTMPCSACSAALLDSQI
jgi:hypothetical protein